MPGFAEHNRKVRERAANAAKESVFRTQDQRDAAEQAFSGMAFKVYRDHGFGLGADVPPIIFTKCT